MFEAFGLSDPGAVRTNNEDYFISDAESGVFILADGMGGANAGEYASHLSAELLYEFLLDPDNRTRLQMLEQGFVQANAAVREAASSDPELSGMGTTLLVARDIGEGRLQIASVGDSRAYLNSRGALSPLTQDHTWVAEMGPRLGLTEEAIRKHPMRHVLTAAVGSAQDLRISSCIVQMALGDTVLLCSDGLHGVVEEKKLSEALDSEKTLAEKSHYLIEAAKNEGGPDNVTVILVQLA